jgi:peptidyl-tRNA hydrolase
MDKFTIIVRADIDPGLQLAQACHAVAAFSQQHPEIFNPWAREVKNIAVLAIPNLSALLDLYELAARKQLSRAVFIEPDLGDEATAIAIGPGAHKICSHLPKALKPPREKSDMAAE